MQKRSTSYSSEYSVVETPSTASTQHRKDSSSSSQRKASSPTVNVYSHCGRHSDQFLFSGWGDVLRGITKRD